MAGDPSFRVITETELAQHLSTLGWTPEPCGARTVRTRHMTPEGELSVYVRLTDHWLIASIVPFLATRGNNSFELSRWLLRQNRDMNQVKFAYDEDGDVVLTVELPTESLDATEIRAALEALVDRAVAHRATLRKAAQAAK